MSVLTWRRCLLRFQVSSIACFLGFRLSCGHAERGLEEEDLGDADMPLAGSANSLCHLLFALYFAFPVELPFKKNISINTKTTGHQSGLSLFYPTLPGGAGQQWLEGSGVCNILALMSVPPLPSKWVTGPGGAPR